MNVSRSNRPLLILLLVFATPVLGGWLMYVWEPLQPIGRTNHGELIEPPATIPELAQLRRLNGSGEEPLAFDGHWTIVSLVNECQEQCEDNLTMLRQIRLAVGEEWNRVERLLVVDALDLGQAESSGPFHGTWVAQGEQARTLGPILTGAGMVHGGTGIIDPFGRLMMIYTPDAEPKHVLKDVQRLLQVSKNWPGEKS